MINFSELDKIVASGKTITIVVLADSKEVFAISFDSATLAYKHLLEAGAAVITAPVIKDKPDSPKPSSAAKTEETAEIEDNEEAPEGVDAETGEIIEVKPVVEPKTEPKKRPVAEPKTEIKVEPKVEPKDKEPAPVKEVKQPGTALTGDVIVDEDEW